MPKRRIPFEKGRPYHIISRAVEGRRVFEDRSDHSRFIFQLYAANVGKPIPNLRRNNVEKAARELLEGKRIPSELVVIEHPPLVYVLSFALVGNHYHLELVQNLKGGISKYMLKVNGGFATHFNLRHERRGILFEGRYKAIPVKTDLQMQALKRYINVVNTLDVCEPGWREKGLKDWEAAFERIKNYQLSSLPDLLGLRHSKILASREVLGRYFGGDFFEEQAECAEFVKDYLKQNLTDFYPLFLEE